jgi:hypothetical protein
MKEINNYIVEIKNPINRELSNVFYIMAVKELTVKNCLFIANKVSVNIQIKILRMLFD